MILFLQPQILVNDYQFYLARFPIAGAIVLALHALMNAIEFSKLFRITIYLLAGVSLLCVLLIGFGFVQDLSGTHCSGLFGTQESCVSSKLFLVQVLPVAYPSFLTVLGILCFAAIISQVFYLQKVRTAKKDS